MAKNKNVASKNKEINSLCVPTTKIQRGRSLSKLEISGACRQACDRDPAAVGNSAKYTRRLVLPQT